MGSSGYAARVQFTQTHRLESVMMSKEEPTLSEIRMYVHPHLGKLIFFEATEIRAIIQSPK